MSAVDLRPDAVDEDQFTEPPTYCHLFRMEQPEGPARCGMPRAEQQPHGVRRVKPATTHCVYCERPLCPTCKAHAMKERGW